MHTATPSPAPRQDRLLRELIHDPYHAKKKPTEPTVCAECGAVYHDGRWQWREAPPGAHREFCPACQRVHDHCPAGFLTLQGGFLAAHRDEILGLLHNIEESHKAEHALKRLIALEDQADGSLLATFTDPGLARATGEALHSAYQGELDFAYQEDEYLLRVFWRR